MTLKEKILCLMLCTLTVLSLISCQPGSKEKEESETATKKPSISVVDGTGDTEEIPWGEG